MNPSEMRKKLELGHVFSRAEIAGMVNTIEFQAERIRGLVEGSPVLATAAYLWGPDGLVKPVTR